MDLRMPLMDGIEATRRIRACEGGREVKIVAVTASGYAIKRDEILSEGLDDYVRKPYRPAEIFECMARHLGVRYRKSETSAESNFQRAGQLRAEDLSALPLELRNELGQAVLALDPARITSVIQDISLENSELGSILALYAKDFSYSKIFAAMPLAQDSPTE
jgi:CheY-like chemotaxis protein